MFTVPVGGDGLYYISSHLAFASGEIGIFDVELNEEVICTTVGDFTESAATDSSQGTCGAVVDLNEGRSIFFWVGLCLLNLFFLCTQKKDRRTLILTVFECSSCIRF